MNLYIKFLDAEGNEYYMSKCLYDYHSISQYIIGRRNCSLEPLVDREFYYQIYEDKTIKLIKTCAIIMMRILQKLYYSHIHLRI